MIFKNERDIISEISKANKNCYYFYGNDGYLIENYTNFLVDKIGISIEDGFNFHEYSNPDDLDSIINNILMLPVFSKKRLVLVKNINFEIIDSEAINDFKNLFVDYPNTTILIISNFSNETDGTLKKKEKDVIKLFDSLGAVFNIETRAESSLVKWVFDYVKKFNCNISRENAKWIVEQNNKDLNNIISDLDKAVSYIGTGEITNEVIEKLIPKSLDTSIYELTKAINFSNYNRAISVINNLKNQDKEPVLIFNVLCSHYNDILRAKTALDEGINIDGIKEKFSYGGRDFVIKNAIKDSKRVSWQFLQKAFKEIYETDIMIKDTSVDAFLVLEFLITKLFLLMQKET